MSASCGCDAPHSSAAASSPRRWSVQSHFCSKSGSANATPAAPAKPRPCPIRAWQSSHGLTSSRSVVATCQVGLALTANAGLRGRSMLLKSGSNRNATRLARRASTPRVALGWALMSSRIRLSAIRTTARRSKEDFRTRRSGERLRADSARRSSPLRFVGELRFSGRDRAPQARRRRCACSRGSDRALHPAYPPRSRAMPHGRARS